MDVQRKIFILKPSNDNELAFKQNKNTFYILLLR